MASSSTPTPFLGKKVLVTGGANGIENREAILPYLILLDD